VATLARGKQVLRTRHSTAVAQVLKGLRDWLSSLWVAAATNQPSYRKVQCSRHHEKIETKASVDLTAECDELCRARARMA